MPEYCQIDINFARPARGFIRFFEVTKSKNTKNKFKVNYKNENTSYIYIYGGGLYWGLKMVLAKTFVATNLLVRPMQHVISNLPLFVVLK